MLNYLARKPEPTRYLSFMPPEVLMFGEAAMLAELRANPPDRVVLVHRVTAEYGTPLFGRDYGRELAAWVASRYAPVQTFGDRRIVAIPLGTDVNDMQFMKFGNVPHLMLDSFNENLEVARAQGDRPAQIDVTVPAHIYGRPRGAYYYEKIIERAASCDDVWIATRAEIADHMLAQNATH